METPKPNGASGTDTIIKLITQDIPRVHLSNAADCQAFLRDGQPVILENIAESWAATGQWTPEYFASNLPEHEIHLYEFTRRDVVPTNFSDFVHYLRTGQRLGELSKTKDPLYLAWDSDVLSTVSALGQALDFEPLFGQGRGITQTAFWMGGVGAHTPLHTDIDSQNLHAVMYGQKKVLLFPPQDEAFLYPSDIYEWTTVFSSVDFRNPDLIRYPKTRQATGYEAVIGAGDILYIPIGWWHTVTCLEPTISVNAWRFSPGLLWSLNLYRDLVRRGLHQLGLYKRDRCTCHGHGDLRRHLDWDG
jgi:hypothetical protein